MLKLKNNKQFWIINLSINSKQIILLNKQVFTILNFIQNLKHEHIKLIWVIKKKNFFFIYFIFFLHIFWQKKNIFYDLQYEKWWWKNVFYFQDCIIWKQLCFKNQYYHTFLAYIYFFENIFLLSHSQECAEILNFFSYSKLARYCLLLYY